MGGPRRPIPNVVWRAGIAHVRVWIDGRDVWRSLHTRYARVARKEAPRAVASLYRGEEPFPRRPVYPLQDVIDEYMDQRGGEFKASTRASHQRRLDAFVKWAKRRVRDLADVTTPLLMTYRTARRKASSTVTASSDMAVVRAFLSYCWRMRYIEENPCSRLPPMIRTPKKQKRILTMDEIGGVEKAAGDPPVRHLLGIAAFAGLRRGELFHLRWEDIDRAAGVVHVRNRPPEFVVKTYEERSVPLAATLADSLPADGQGRIFTLAKHVDSFSDLSRAAFKAAKVTGSLHLFRHSWITYLLLAGYSVVQVMAWAGHSQIATTQGYTHVRQAVAGEDVKRFKTAFGA